MVKHDNGYYIIWNSDQTDMGPSDEVFVMGKGKSKTVFYVHKKVLLSCGSRKFDELLFEESDEKVSFRKTKDDPEAFELLMNFIYGEYDKFTSWIPVCKLCIIGEKYQVPNIREIAKQYMINVTDNCRAPMDLTKDNIWKAIENNVFWCPLLNEMHDYLKENADELICSEEFFSAPVKFVYEILSMDALRIEECDILHAVTEWGCRNMETANFENLKKFYKHIRFGALKYDDFLRFKECYPKALDEKDFQDIAQYLYSTSILNLPEWCSKNHVWRKNVFKLEKRMTGKDEQKDFANEEREQEVDDKQRELQQKYFIKIKSEQTENFQTGENV